jgi:hypothetical protein
MPRATPTGRQSPSEIIRVKAAVRKRDNDCCARCGMTDDQHRERYGRSLDVHRHVPGSEYSLDGASLRCRVCHAREPKRASGTPDLAYGSRGRTVLLSRQWHTVIRQLAAGKRQPVLWWVIAATIERAERAGIATPPPPWES